MSAECDGTSSVKLETACCGCLGKVESAPIASDLQELWKLFQRLTGIQYFVTHDVLSRQFCKNCVSLLRSFNSFVERAKSINKLLTLITIPKGKTSRSHQSNDDGLLHKIDENDKVFFNQRKKEIFNHDTDNFNHNDNSVLSVSEANIDSYSNKMILDNYDDNSQSHGEYCLEDDNLQNYQNKQTDSRVNINKTADKKSESNKNSNNDDQCFEEVLLNDDQCFEEVLLNDDDGTRQNQKNKQSDSKSNVIKNIRVTAGATERNDKKHQNKTNVIEILDEDSSRLLLSHKTPSIHKSNPNIKNLPSTKVQSIHKILPRNNIQSSDKILLSNNIPNILVKKAPPNNNVLGINKTIPSDTLKSRFKLVLEITPLDKISSSPKIQIVETINILCNICQLWIDPELSEEQRNEMEIILNKKPYIPDSEEDKNRSYQCQKCAYIVNSHGQRVIQCKFCEKVFRKESAKNYHVEKEHKQQKGPATFFCDECPRYYINKKSLVMHLAEKHSEGTPFLTCHLCGKGYKTHRCLKQHMQYHEALAKKEFVCSYCAYAAASIGNLKSHMVHKHTDSDDRPFECDHCGRRCKSKEQIYKHMKSHAGESAKKHRCQICDKAFDFKHKVRSHMLVHGERNLKCPLCPKLFNEKRKVKRHLRNVHKQIPHETRTKEIIQEL